LDAVNCNWQTLVVATTHGNVITDCVVDGKPVVVGLNAYLKKSLEFFPIGW